MTIVVDRIPGTSADRHRPASSVLSQLAAAGAAVDRAALALLVWLERTCQRRQLLGLDDRALKDFGANRCDADTEGSKPFWRR